MARESLGERKLINELLVLLFLSFLLLLILVCFESKNYLQTCHVGKKNFCANFIRQISGSLRRGKRKGTRKGEGSAGWRGS
jgi:hypothetical protein